MSIFAGFGLKALGFLKAIPPIVWLILAVAGLFAVTVHDRNKWKARATAYNAEAAASYEATKLASSNPKLERKNTPKQIALLGQAIADLKAAIASQNAAVNAAAAKTAEQRQAAATALRNAAGRIRDAESVSARLNASARTAAPQAACKPSKVLEQQWR